MLSGKVSSASAICEASTRVKRWKRRGTATTYLFLADLWVPTKQSEASFVQMQPRAELQLQHKRKCTFKDYTEQQLHS